MDLDTTLAALAADPSHPVDLAGVALHLARDEYPDLDVAAYLDRLDAYADVLAPRVAAGAVAERVAELALFLFDEEGFGPNDDDYYDPRNSYFSDVLDRRVGIPITLSVLAIGVGGRAGLTVEGVGLPGHFVAKAVADGGEVLFDPYHGGQLLDPSSCEALVSAVTGQPFAATRAALAATPPGLVVARMLNNLKGAYLRTGDFRRAARVMHRLVQLDPDDPVQRRDLGVTLVHAEYPGRAVAHLQHYLARVPDAADADAVRDFLKRAKADVARWN